MISSRRPIGPPAGGPIGLNALLTVNNDLGPRLQLLDRPDTPLLGTGARGELFNQERDALGLILELSGIDRAELERWVPPDGDVPFLTGLSSYVEREDAMVDHDLHRFGTGPARRRGLGGTPSPTVPAGYL